ncbi:MAG: GNAT family N-acetyltransferase [Gammaproteobacteria bacterium]|nr:GNAT family N-acetyltransferase [Gammaproteobacteria bacterium]
MEPSEKLRLFGVEDDGQDGLPIALMVGFMSRLYAVHTRARVLRFSQPDSMPYTPILSQSIDEPRKVFERVVKAIYDARPRYEIVRFGPLDPESSLFHDLLRTLRDAGQIVQTFHVFTNRYEIITGRTSEEYFRARPSALRNTLRRQGKKLDASGNSRFELVTGGATLDRSIADFDHVFAASWKEGEQLVSVQYLHSIMKCAAEADALRLGLIYLDNEPAAAQFWIVSKRAAYCYRLAYNKKYRKLSIGSILTQRIIEHVIEVDGVNIIDLGIGDDHYKKDWASKYRERFGIAAFNPRTVRGLRSMVRHVGGRAVKRSIMRPLRALANLVSYRNS